jgi:hypothetical protein
MPYKLGRIEGGIFFIFNSFMNSVGISKVGKPKLTSSSPSPAMFLLLFRPLSISPPPSGIISSPPYSIISPSPHVVGILGILSLSSPPPGILPPPI